MRDGSGELLLTRGVGVRRGWRVTRRLRRWGRCRLGGGGCGVAHSHGWEGLMTRVMHVGLGDQGDASDGRRKQRHRRANG